MGDEIATPDAGAVETPIAPAGDATPSAAPDAGAPPVAAQPPEWQKYLDEGLSKRDAQWMSYFEQLKADQKKQYDEFHDKVRSVFDPQFAKERSTPRYVTQDELRQMYEHMSRSQVERIERVQLIAEFKTGLAQAQEKYPAIFKGPFAKYVRAAIKDTWTESDDGPSVLDIAREIDAQLAGLRDEQQKALLEGKDKLEKQIPHGGVKSGGAITTGPFKREPGGPKGLKFLKKVLEVG